MYHIRGALSFLLHGDITSAVNWHLLAKATDPTTTPPLAGLHLTGQGCGGLGDIFYVMAVVTKQFADSQVAGYIDR